MIYVFLIIIIAIIVFVWYKTYHLDLTRSITAYTGGVGSGKTFLSVRQAIKAYKTALKEWRIEKCIAWLLRREKPDKPILFSNVPIIYKNKFKSAKLTPEIVLLQVRIPEKSIVLVDEVSGFLNQFEYNKNTNVRLFDEFCRFYRQYIGGQMIINDQCSANVVLQIRRRLNTIYNLNKHRYHWGLTLVKVREINISDEIVSIDDKDTNEPYQLFMCLGNYFKYYESRCYKPRYLSLPMVEPVYHDDKFTKTLFVCPDKLFPNVIENNVQQECAGGTAVSAVSGMPKVSGNADCLDDFIDNEVA